MANLYAFLACADAGESIVAPPAGIAGHVTHHAPGAAGLRGLTVAPAPIDADRYTIDVDALAVQAEELRPAMITVGGSLNLTVHDVPSIREVADRVGAVVLFDAAHLSGPIAGGAWPNPLELGAHVMTMSTYKSLGGPPAGLLLTTEDGIAERVDAIAFPGLTANFDAAKTAALGITLAEWLAVGAEYAAACVATARRLAAELADRGVAVLEVEADRGRIHTDSHAFAVDARGFGGGTALAARLRAGNLLASAIGLPTGPDDGLRLGTNELVRWGVGPDDTPTLAELLAGAILDDPRSVADDVTAWRSGFPVVHWTLPVR